MSAEPGAKPSRKTRKAAAEAPAGTAAEVTTATTDTTATAPVEGETAGVALQEVTVAEPAANEAAPVEGAAPTEGKSKAKKATKPAQPEDQKKGNRICAACLTPEANFLAKNPRYSLCQGVDVYCYRKGHRVLYGTTMDAVREQFPTLFNEDGTSKVIEGSTPPTPYIESVSGTGIKPGILVRGQFKVGRKAAANAAASTTSNTEALKQAAVETGDKAAAVASEAGPTTVTETTTETAPVVTEAQ